MKRLFILFGLTLLVVFASASAFASSPTEGFVPTWKVGEKWILEATYRDLKVEGEAWLPPVEWVFRVRAIKQLQGVDCYVIHVFPRRSELKNQAVLWLSVADLRPMRVVDIFPSSEGMRHADRDLESVAALPLVANDTIVPYDFPVFPLNRANSAVQGADGFGAYRSQPAEKKFARVSNVGGLSFKRVYGQKSKAPDKQYADTFAAYRSSGKTYQVEIAEERAGIKIVQLWQQGSPWAVSSESREKKVRLLPPSAPTPLPGASQENGGDF
jgi:hypothetical protein